MGTNPTQQRRLPATLTQTPAPVKQESIPDSSSALAITNRFTPLGSTVGNIRPNYQTALATPYDPYSSVRSPAPSQPKTPSYAKTSPYVQNPHSEKLFSIPLHIDKNQPPERIAKLLLPPNFHFLPTESYKSLKYYQAILSETESIAIKPIYSTTHQNKILYHSLHIGKFLTELEWGIPLFHTKPLHTQHVLIPNNHYNYYDYIQAWTNIFLHQTEDFSHSWFITFDKNFRLRFPAWFPDWWASHGPSSSIIPDDLRHVLTNNFQPSFDRSRFDNRVTIFSLLMAKYKIPWILKWNFEMDTGGIYRTRWVKWWDKFNHQKIIDLVKVEFPQASFQALPIKVSSSSSQALPVHQQFPELPKAQEPVQSLSDISPSSSLKGISKSAKSSSSKKEKTTQLLDMAQLLMAEAALLQKKKGSDSDSDNSDASSQLPAKWADQADFQDAQDPFDI